VSTETHTNASEEPTQASVSLGVADLLKEGDGLAREKKWSEALERYRAAVAFEPANAHIHFLIGSCHFKLNEGPQAREALFRAVSLDPANEKIRTWIYRITGMYPGGQVPEA